ncbi:MAG TPA: DUF4105 domain-containing protein [Chitinispirillaceae bacterium]|nr:DUF4105 domain-containing protein [Chitinispirillaceae bacterium]
MKKHSVLRGLFFTVAGIFFIAIVVVVYSVKGPSLRKEQFVSMSTPPENNGENPRFSNCDSIPCSCSCDDPYDPRFPFSNGEFDGLCPNSCILRSVKRIDAKEAAQRGYFKDSVSAGSSVYVVNVFHEPTDTTFQTGFYAAKIDLSGIKNIIFQLEFAGGVQGHAQIRISFDESKPVLLVSQLNGASREVLSETELNYSVEALGPPGIPYKGDFGFRGEYRQAHRLVTQYSRAVRMIKDLHRQVFQYRLKLTNGQKRAIFLQLLAQSQNADPNERYHTSRNNCVLKIFDIVDKVVQPPFYRKPLLLITNNTLFIPTRMEQHLKYRGLLKNKPDSLKMKNLEVELVWERAVNDIIIVLYLKSTSVPCG